MGSTLVVEKVVVKEVVERVGERRAGRWCGAGEKRKLRR